MMERKTQVQVKALVLLTHVFIVILLPLRKSTAAQTLKLRVIREPIYVNLPIPLVKMCCGKLACGSLPWNMDYCLVNLSKVRRN